MVRHELLVARYLISLWAVNINYTNLHDLQTGFHSIDFCRLRRLVKNTNYLQYCCYCWYKEESNAWHKTALSMRYWPLDRIGYVVVGSTPRSSVRIPIEASIDPKPTEWMTMTPRLVILNEGTNEWENEWQKQLIKSNRSSRRERRWFEKVKLITR